MPLAKSLTKVTKTKNSNKLNPRSRKFKQLARAQLRDDKLSQKKQIRGKAFDHKSLRLHFFREFDSSLGKDVYDLEDLHAMISAFIQRSADELDAEKAARRPGRPASSKQDALENQLQNEQDEYRDGFKVPDLQDEEVVKALRNWDGSQGATGGIRMIELKQE